MTRDDTHWIGPADNPTWVAAPTPATGYVAPPEPGHPPIWQPTGEPGKYIADIPPIDRPGLHRFDPPGVKGVDWDDQPPPPHPVFGVSGQPYSGATPAPGGSDSGGGKRRPWVARHKALTFVLVVVGLVGVFLIAAAVSLGTSTPGGPLNAPVATGKPSAAHTSTAPTADPTDDPPSDGTVKVGQSVTYEDGTVVTVASVKRVAFSDVSYGVRGTGVSVVVKVTNGGSSVLDLSLAQVELTYGADGQESDQVFDSAKGFEGGLATKVAPGRSATAKYGFAVPKGAQPVSVQVTPDFSSETAIFEGRTS